MSLIQKGLGQLAKATYRQHISGTIYHILWEGRLLCKYFKTKPKTHDLMMAFLPLKRHPFKFVDINGTTVIDASDLYNTLGNGWHWRRKAPILGASSFQSLPGSQGTLTFHVHSDSCIIPTT